MFESPVLGLAKDCNQTGLRSNKTKTEKDHLLVFCSFQFLRTRTAVPFRTGPETGPLNTRAESPGMPSVIEVNANADG